MENSLFVVSTPIGHLDEFSIRAIDTLKSVDFIICEDTRVSMTILKKFGIKKPLISYNKFSEMKKLNNIIDRLKNGEKAALISDAGTPCIQDPGEILVKQCHKNNIRLTAISGPCAFISAVVISGLSTKRICFEGFLSKDKNQRYSTLSQIKNLEHTIVFYESPHRLLKTLIDIYTVVGERRVAIVKEISKIYENVFLTTITEAISFYKENIPKGEFVIVLEGMMISQDEYNLYDAINLAKELVIKGYQKKDASKIIALQTGLKKTDIYKGLI